MKLLTKKETDNLFVIHSMDLNEGRLMCDSQFNDAVNALLMDAKIVKSLLKQAKRIKENNS